ncbi:MAG TPA: protein-disulfide reductase DsbD [Burkholderiales bacterium]|nr:protein-disulfide reductase DsbD [Burkholderiales bacterium]
MKRFLVALVWLSLASPAAAQWFKKADELLEPEKAFRFSARVLEGAVEVQFAIADGYYMYRDKFRFSTEGNPSVQLGVAELPRGARHKDEFFGDTETYRRQVTIRIPAQGEGRFELKVVSQGCADLGVCYVPMESQTALHLAAGTLAASNPERRWSVFASDMDIAQLFQGNVALVLASFFGFGLLLSFTPCVLPMIPILGGIIAGEGARLNKSRALALSGTYVLSMALTYAAAGIAAAYVGSLLAAYLQNVWVLGAFAAVFVLLALSMFGVYELRLPHAVQQRLHGAHGRLKGGRLASVAAMGVLSAVIVSPCVSAPLAGALLEISRSGDMVLGGSALFAMALGMGVPLMLVGLSEGALLPRAGAWMVGVKKFFGLMLLAVAVWILSPVLPPLASMLAWSLLAFAAASLLRRSWIAAAVPLVAGIALLVGALAGSRDPLRPLAVFTAGTPHSAPVAWTRVASLEELQTRLKAPGKTVMLDFYADWCVSCKEMEAFTFSDPKVRSQLDQMLLLQVDVTANNENDKALLKRFSLFGPPGIIFFNADGGEIKGLRVIGYQNAERFLKTLSLATAP